MAVAGEINAPAIRRPGDGAAVVVVPGGELARRAALCRDHEYVGMSVRQGPCPVHAKHGALHHHRRLGPVRAPGLVGQLAHDRGFGRRQQRKRQPLAVGRPGKAARRPVQAGKLQRFAAVDPAHENLHSRSVAGQIRNPLVVGRDVRAAIVHRAGGQRARITAVDIHAPQIGPPAVLHDVHEVVRVDQERAVGAHLGIAGIGQCEHVLG